MGYRHVVGHAHGNARAYFSYALAGIEPEGEALRVNVALQQSSMGERFKRLFQREFDVGDIVFAYCDDLCQIIETAKSSYGNTSYKVRYLGKRPVAEITEDWFPSQYILLLYRRRDIKPAMIEAVRATGIRDDQLAALERVTEEEAARALARSFEHLERTGALSLMGP